MTCELVALCVDANDPAVLAEFWAAVLGREVEDDGSGEAVLPPDGEPGFTIRFAPTSEPKVGPNQMHFDLASTTSQDQAATVTRALERGASHLDVGQLPQEEHVVLADPEGNEFCVIEAGNGFLAGTPRIGCLSSDGSPRVGHFWSEALGWPLVWDQDEETAIQSARGGSKISWGGPPYTPRSGTQRWRWHLAPPPGGDQQAEVERLLGRGASRLASGRRADGAVVLADPDGNEFRVLPAGTAG
jgi:catechol 2,3-dioxygenase-like lactoylglutathione lyase family enzyme